MGPIRLGNLVLDRERYEVRINSVRVDLTFTEFALLEQLIDRAGRVVLQDELLQALWGDASPEVAGRLRVQMSRLRKKLEGSRPWAIRTVQKRGYALADLSEDEGRERSTKRQLRAIEGGQPW